MVRSGQHPITFLQPPPTLPVLTGKGNDGWKDFVIMDEEGDSCYGYVEVAEVETLAA